MDSSEAIKRHGRSEGTSAFVAAFAYIDVTLVDVTTTTVIRHTTVTASKAIDYSAGGGGVSWDALSVTAKVSALNQLLSNALTNAIAQIFNPPTATQ